MKLSHLRCFLCFALIFCLFLSAIPNAFALESSKGKSTGYSKGQVINSEFGTYGRGRTVRRYTRAKDIYVSEYVKCDSFVRDVSDLWMDTSCGGPLTYSQSISIGGSGSVNLIKKMGLNTSISISKNTAKGYNLYPNTAYGKYCKIAAKADFFIVQYNHVTYDKNGKQTSTSKKELKIPINNTGVLYLKYTN